MTATYSPGLDTPKDEVRLWIGDTSTASPLFQDEEIAAVLNKIPNTYLAAATLADSLAAKFSRSVSFSVEGLSISNSTKAGSYRDLARRLRAQAVGVGSNSLGGAPFVGGISPAAPGNTPVTKPSQFPIGNDGYLPPEIDTNDYS